jgi:hypothetical protein
MGVIRKCKECQQGYEFTGGSLFCKKICKEIWGKVRDMKSRAKRKQFSDGDFRS